MIRVELAPEPDDFDAKVRQPGLQAIHILTGRVQQTGPGRPRKSAGRYSSPVDIPSSEFDKDSMAMWRRCISDLHRAYGGICAYSCVYVEPVVGDPTVDHFLPKSGTYWECVYEWQNYRLATTRMNRNKGQKRVLDPFCISNRWFRLELVEFQVTVDSSLEGKERQDVLDTIMQLELNDYHLLELRKEYAQAYWDGDVSLSYLERKSPFVARELIRQGRLREE